MRASSQPEELARSPSPTVFVSDPSAEAERIAQALRTSGYVVVDVPMSMLLARVAVQRPRVILVDADTDGALESIERLRDLPDAEDIDVVFLGKAGVALEDADDAKAHEASGFFERPVDIPALVRKVEALTGGAVHEADASRHSTPPPSLPASRMPASGPPSKRTSSLPPPAKPSDPAASSVAMPAVMPATAPEPTLPTSRQLGRRSVSIQTPLSSELEALLVEAERRLGDQMAMEVGLPTPEEEIEAVLPAEVLSSLDDPVDEEDEEPAGRGEAGNEEPPAHETGAFRATTNAGEGSALRTHGGGHASPTTGSAAVDTSLPADRAPATSAVGPQPMSRREGTGPPPPTEYQPPPPTEHQAPGLVMAPLAGQGASSTLGSVALQADASAFDAILAPHLATTGVDRRPGNTGVDRGGPTTGVDRGPTGSNLERSSGSHVAGPSEGRPSSNKSTKAESVPPPNAAPGAVIPTVLGPNDAPALLARAIASRATGALCVESDEGIRRAVLREGDLVTAASGVDAESLLAFLGARGDLPRDTVQQLIGKVPPFGRHAGAALVAHGHLRQDQLWPVLRAHAEWILGRAILVARGTAHLEADAPGRLKGEPSVFGGSTGAEVLVEVVRRVIAPDDAIARLGGPGGRLGEGSAAALLSECALGVTERDLVGRMRGATVKDVLEVAPGADFASVVYALSLLGVVDVIRGVGLARGAPAAEDAEIDALDEEAIRARVRARIEIVDDGDYFAVLGVSHDATGYEVRRAFLELRRAFEPSRVLTPRIADLADDVRKISTVLEEAYEILRDNARRERYRRAILAAPAS